MRKLPSAVDVICDLSFGDSGKGKVSAYLSKVGKYSSVARWAGGDNAGHTVFLNGKKYKTNLIPSGIFHNKLSIIGPGCVLNIESFNKELSYLKENGFNTDLVKVSPKCHIVTDEHIAFDKENLSKKLGTTSRGIAPAYAAKAARTGILAKDCLSKDLLWDEDGSGEMLCEGAQGFYLDIDHGNYPYVTSSTTLPYGACSIGFPPSLIRDIYGVVKLYDTRSGEDPLFPETLFDDPELSRLGELGEEYGVVTKRRRKVNWLSMDRLIHAIRVSGANNIIINKCDVLEALGVFKVIFKNEMISFENIDSMKLFINKNIVSELGSLKNQIVFSSDPELL